MDPNTMEDDASARSHVRAELRELVAEPQGYTPEELKSGGWFAKLLRTTLDVYSTEVTWEYFVRKYPGLPADIIASRRIELAQRYAMIEGAISASAYNAAIAATLTSKGGASPIAIPAGVSSFVIDLVYTSRLQLRLAFDLAVIYRRPIDLDDAEDLYDLIRLAFGVKVGEVLRGGLPRIAPEAVRLGIKSLIRCQTLPLLKQLPIIGRYLFQRNLIKFGIPAVGIPLSMKLNHSYTGMVGRQARQIYRDKLLIQERASDAAEALSEHAWLLLEVAYLVGIADKEFSAEDTWFIRDLLAQIGKSPAHAGIAARFAAIVEIDKEATFKQISLLPEEPRWKLQGVACQIAAADHKISGEKLSFLTELSEVCGRPLDEAALRKDAKVA